MVLKKEAVTRIASPRRAATMRSERLSAPLDRGWSSLTLSNFQIKQILSGLARPRGFRCPHGSQDSKDGDQSKLHLYLVLRHGLLKRMTKSGKKLYTTRKRMMVEWN
ncbi:hypothetical protein NE237_022141 [Protea cynaroides]|uniref:Uncharacterized protein n=1 Tax=Protea cynaroides TaxID=273540 RepID=A0A9Q0HDT1_9MAGN|nr:hypothetical protein NE237_022141 [Protea cynaroides]